ncbi:MAG: DUF6273 domain-containing protein [Butyrivibrio sp.]
MYIFISHSSTDASIANELCNAIESNGDRCFLAPRDIRSGYEYAAEIITGIDKSDVMLLILSEEANKSPHVLREVERAVTKSIPIIVYKLEDVVLSKSLEYFLMAHQWMNADKGSHEELLRSINNLKAREAASPYAPPVSAPAKNKNKHKYIIPVIGVLVTVVIILAVALIINSVNKNHDKDSPTTGASAENNTSQTPAEINTTEESTTSSKPDNVQTDVQLGDTVVFGRYNDADIYWQVLHISDDGKEAVMVARDVLTFKAFDAAESGKYNYKDDIKYYGSDSPAETDLELQAYVRGNSSWENSNIRTWLNSSKRNVTYEGQAPIALAMADGKNGYDHEAGFLNGFTDEELSAIVETTIETKGNDISDSDTIVTQDKVFLLSLDELEWFKEADVSLLADPTPESLEKNTTFWYNDYCIGFGLTACMWWLRDPVENYSCQCYLVGNGYREENIYTWEVGVESFGIRPAITVDLTSGCINAE